MLIFLQEGIIPRDEGESFKDIFLIFLELQLLKHISSQNVDIIDLA
jgi:hypothetical protein